DGKLGLSMSREGRIQLWDVMTAKHLKSFDDPKGYKLAFSVDGKGIYSRWATVNGWDLASGHLVQSLVLPVKEATTFAYTADEKLALSGEKDGTLTLWDLKTGAAVRTFDIVKGVPETIWAVAFSADGKLALSGGGGPRLLLWDVATGRLV